MLNASNEISKELDSKLGIGKEEDHEEKTEIKDYEGKSYLHILVDESDDKTGFGCNIEMAGPTMQLLEMLAQASGQVMELLLKDEK